MYFIIVDFVV